MKWKIIIVVALISATAAALKIQATQIDSVTAERDLVQQHLDNQRDKTRSLMQELSNQALIIQQQQLQLKKAVVAHNRAVKRNQELAGQHEQAIQKLQQLKQQSPDLKTWSVDSIPADADSWLRDLNTGTDGDNKAGNDSAATTARSSD